MKKIAVLGSTGSIGTQTLDVIKQNPDKFELTALSCGHNIGLFEKQLEEFSPKAACVADEKDAMALSEKYPGTEFVFGKQGRYREFARSDSRSNQRSGLWAAWRQV